jgi:putative tryptophan/tyrosine transport system substrate-binding protein
MQRRQFITFLGGAAAAWPHTARAQQAERMRRIGVLSGQSRPASIDSNPLGGLSQGMHELGYVEGKDFLIEWRFAEGRYDLFPDLAAELVRLKVDVIVTSTSGAVRAAQRATSTIPIVMSFSTDPVGNGFVASLARPGGNTTGLASQLEDMTQKQLELLAAVVPNLSRVGILVNPDVPQSAPILKSAQAAAQNSGLLLVIMETRNQRNIESAFVTLTKEAVGAIMIVSDSLFATHRYQIAELALSYRLPSLFPQREYVDAGGLLSYGESLRDFNRRAAYYVDKIFKWAKPADLPVQQPTNFFLVINLKTARTLNVTIPPGVITIADEVIE